MTTRFFHIYADGETVREISWEEWRKICNQDYNSSNTRLLCRIDDTEIYFHKGQQFIWVRKSQLMQILKEVST